MAKLTNICGFRFGLTQAAEKNEGARLAEAMLRRGAPPEWLPDLSDGKFYGCRAVAFCFDGEQIDAMGEAAQIEAFLRAVEGSQATAREVVDCGAREVAADNRVAGRGIRPD